MQSAVSLDKFRYRVEISASGQWSMTDADHFHRQMRDVRLWGDQHSAIRLSILADLDGLNCHTADVAERVALTVDEIRYMKRDKYALVVPSYLMRMQCRRLLAGIDHRIFDTLKEAMDWLGWQPQAQVRAA